MGENVNYHQFGNAYLQYEITLGNAATYPDSRFFDGDGIGLVKMLLPKIYQKLRNSSIF